MGSNNEYEHQQFLLTEDIIFKYKDIYDILYSRIEEDLCKRLLDNNDYKSVLPKE